VAPYSPTRAAAVALLVTLGATALLVAAADGVSPLDDAYIHLAVARTLVEHGTWGVNAGEFASASSSPGWTALLALVLRVAPAGYPAALGLASVSAAAVLWLAARGLWEDGLPGRWVNLGLAALVLAVPLPFLVGLGMEHVLHLALVLALVRTTARPAAPGEGRARLGAVAALAAAAVLVRTESAFVVAGLVAVLAWERRRVEAAVLGGAAFAALAAFGAWSVAQGGWLLPNSVLMKAPARQGWWDGVVMAVDASGPLLALVGVAGLAPAALALPAAHRRRAFLFVVAALLQLAFGRVGWLFRYEAWLVGWGVLLLVPVGRALAERGGGALAPLLLVAAPLGVRSVEATWRYAPGARFVADVNQATADLLRSGWPGVRVAVEDLGVVAWAGGGIVTDLGGLGTTAITELHLGHRLRPDTVGAVLAERGVEVVVSGRAWMGGDVPPGLVEVGSLWAPYPSGPGVFETVYWATSGEAAGRLGPLLHQLAASARPEVRVHVADEAGIPLAEGEREGGAVQLEGATVAFYTNGRLRLRAPASGALVVDATGSVADGRPPWFTVEVAGRSTRLEASPAGGSSEVGPVSAGDTILIVYEDDQVDALGNDRNLWVRGVRVRTGGLPAE